MSYFKIPNLYRNPDALTLPEGECYAMEKIDGTSAHIKWKDGKVHFFSGGSKFETFKALFDEEALTKRFSEFFNPESTVTIYGEAYGSKIQGFAHRYGNELKFVAFEVNLDGVWLSVQAAEAVVKDLNVGIEFVHYVRIPCTVEALNAERDKPSVQAERNGMGVQDSEGIIIRPLTERFREDGTRCIWKHKRDREREMKTPRSLDPDKNKVLEDARAIAEEWVVENRLRHVMDSVAIVKYGMTPEELKIEHTKDIIEAMVVDVVTEGRGEFVDTKEARQAISKRAAVLFHAHLKKIT